MKAKYNLYSILILLFAWVILSLNIYAVTQNQFGSSSGIFLVIGIIMQGMFMSWWSSCIIREENTILSFANIIITALLCFAGYLYRETISIASMTGFFNQWTYRNGYFLLLWVSGSVVVFLYKLYDMQRQKVSTETNHITLSVIFAILPFLFLFVASQLPGIQERSSMIWELSIPVFCAICILWHLITLHLHSKKQALLIACIILCVSILCLFLQMTMHLLASSVFTQNIIICILFYIGAAIGNIALSCMSYKIEEREKITTYI